MNFLIILFTSSFIMSLIMLVVYLFSTLSSNLITAKTRYIMWIILLIGLIIPFRPLFGTGLIKFETPLIGQETQLVSYIENTDKKEDFQVKKDTNINQVQKEDYVKKLKYPKLDQIILFVWASGAIFLFLKYLIQYKKFCNIIKRWGKEVTDLSTIEIFEWTKAKMGLENRNIRLLSCNLITTPMLTGIFKPTVLLPEKEIKDDEMELILTHELTHYKHKDIVVNLISIIVLCIHWFNPIIYFCFPAIHGDGESCCDESILKNKDIDYRRFYGEVIISMIESSPQKHIAFSTCFYAKKLNIKKRLFNIMQINKNVTTVSLLSIVSIICLTLISGSIIVFAGPKSMIDIEKAKQLAIEDAKLEDKNTSYEKLQLNKQGLQQFYDIEFSQGEKQYKYKIDSQFGRILGKNSDVKDNIGEKIKTENPNQNSKKNSDFSKDNKSVENQIKNNKKVENKTKNLHIKNEISISWEQAQNIALNHTGLNKDKVKITKSGQKKDGNKTIYEVEFYSNNIEYEYEIDKNSGEIISFEKNDVQNKNTQINEKPKVVNNENNDEDIDDENENEDESDDDD